MATINPYGKEIISVSTEFEGRPLTLEVNRVGFRSTGSVLVRYGDTVVLGTAQVGSRPVVLDYFPLSIDYEEKFYAAGKISGSRFIKREGRPSDEAVLIGRLIDRPIRPLFPKGYRQEVQVVSSVLSMDPAFRPDMVAMIAASAALMLTGTPFDGPVAGLRIGRVNGEFKAFLSAEERDASDLDLVVAGIESGITMVEAGANEVPEEVIADALAWAFDHYQPAIALQRELAEKLQPAAQTYELVLPNAEIQEAVDGWVEGKFGEALRKPYPERNEMINQIRWAFHEEMAEKVGEDYPALRDEYDEAFTSAVHKDVRKGIVEDHIRPDGRAFDEIRPLSSEVGILPRTHGSALFTRGVTQALNIVTLAPLSYAQMVDTMEVNDGERRYILAPKGLKAGDRVQSGEDAAIKVGNALPLARIPIGMTVHNVEINPGQGAKMARSAGAEVQIMSRDGERVQLRLPSGEIREVAVGCQATVGQVGNVDHGRVVLGKAGRSRWLGRRPKVRGVVMNPVDHPHGGGEGKSSGGRHPVTPWGKPTKGYKTRQRKKYSNKFILVRRDGRPFERK